MSTARDSLRNFHIAEDPRQIQREVALHTVFDVTTWKFDVVELDLAMSA